MKDVLGREVPDDKPAFVVPLEDDYDGRCVHIVARASDVLNQGGYVYSSLFGLAESANPGEYPVVSDERRVLIMRGRYGTVSRTGVSIPHPDMFFLRYTCPYIPCEIYPLSDTDASFFRPEIEAIERFYERLRVPQDNMRDWL